MEKNERPRLNYLQEFNYEKTAVLAGKMTTGDSIALKPVVENLGLNWSSQRKRIERDERISQLWSQEKVIAADGKSREMLCLPPLHFQEWLWSLNASENLNISLWESYKKGLVVYLMEMLKISLDEVKRLRNVETMYFDVKTKVDQYFKNESQGKDHIQEGKALFKENIGLKSEILNMFKKDPNQLGLEF